MTRTRNQFRLSWLREGMTRPKQKLFATEASAKRHYRILTSAEPWREWQPDDGPDSYVCCDGGVYSQCGCGGDTQAEKRDAERKDLPPIVSIKLDRRIVTTTAFEACEL